MIFTPNVNYISMDKGILLKGEYMFDTFIVIDTDDMVKETLPISEIMNVFRYVQNIEETEDSLIVQHVKGLTYFPDGMYDICSNCKLYRFDKVLYLILNNYVYDLSYFSKYVWKSTKFMANYFYSRGKYLYFYLSTNVILRFNRQRNILESKENSNFKFYQEGVLDNGTLLRKLVLY